MELIRRLMAELKAQVLLLGDRKEQDICAEVAAATGAADLCGRLSLMEAAAVLNDCDLLVCNDTGLMHMASALKKPLVAVFGPTARQLGFYPFGEKSRVIENNRLRCRPCTHMGRDRCPKKHFRCMRDILPQQVFDAVVELIGQSAP